MDGEAPFSLTHRKVQSLVQAPWFNRVVTGFILLGAILVGCETSPELIAQAPSLFAVLNAAVVLVFGLEMVLRLWAAWPRWHDFFRAPWNVFDFVLVLVSLWPVAGHHVMLTRLLRLVRTLRMLRALPKLQVMVNALVLSLPSMGSVLLLLSLLFYVYGCAGVFLFSETSPEHFSSLSDAIFTLFQLVTLEGWQDIYQTVSDDFGLGATVYFVSFIILGTMVVMNLLIGVVLEGMTEAQKSQTQSLLAKPFGGTETSDDLSHLEQDLLALHARVQAMQRRSGLGGKNPHA